MGDEAQSPYREGRPLEGFVAPDRRRRAAIVLACASLVSGVLWFRFAEDARAVFRESHPRLVAAPRAAPNARHVDRVTLVGASDAVTLPLPTGAIVNVWLEGCSDCMPAFEAWAKLAAHRDGQWSRIPKVNVAYGRADRAWAERYDVADNLVFDRTGSALVNPLGIGSFTTLVIDSDGTVLLADRPDRPGFAERVDDAIARVHAPPRSTPPRASP